MGINPTVTKGLCKIMPGALQASCSVCGDAAASHLHYGAISCYSCRAFFRSEQETSNKF